MRALSEQFMNDLKEPEGILNPILERVKNDQTLMLAIRKDNVNIYYRGGNLLKITQHNSGGYQAYFDTQYNPALLDNWSLPGFVHKKIETNEWVEAFPYLKQAMDGYFSTHPKAEREFQQLVARENNGSTISNESEYFISDIEVNDSDLGARFDMLAIRWQASQRRTGNNCKAAFIEMKYADGALGGEAGILKHLRDMYALISDKSRYELLLQTMESQFNQLDQLELLNFNKGISNAVIKLDPADKPEAIFILANHNPRSTKLKTILNDPQVDDYVQTNVFDLKFFISSFAGYGLHTDCMLGLDEFRKML